MRHARGADRDGTGAPPRRTTWRSRCRRRVSRAVLVAFRIGEQRAACPARTFHPCCGRRRVRRHSCGTRSRRPACCELLAVRSGPRAVPNRRGAFVTAGPVAEAPSLTARPARGFTPAGVAQPRRDDRVRAAAARARLGRAGRRGRPARLPARQHRRARRRCRPHRVHARRPARVRRRPHRVDRQHHPQARRRGQVVGQRGLLVLPRPLVGGLPRQPPARRRRPLGRRRRPGRGLRRGADPRAGRHRGGRLVPGPHRADEPGGGRRHRPGLPPDAQRRVRRGRARAPPAQPGLPGPAARAGHPAGQQAVAPLPDRPAHGPRLRHRDPGRAARAGRRVGRLRAALVRDPRAAGPVRGRHEPVRHRRRRADVTAPTAGRSSSRSARSSTTSPSRSCRSPSRWSSASWC